MVGDAMDNPTRNIRAWLALKTGHTDMVFWLDKRPVIVPRSMSDMSLAELESFWDDAREVIRAEVLPHTPPALAEQITIRLEGSE
jgi:hypothetical protein